MIHKGQRLEVASVRQAVTDANPSWHFQSQLFRNAMHGTMPNGNAFTLKQKPSDDDSQSAAVPPQAPQSASPSHRLVPACLVPLRRARLVNQFAAVAFAGPYTCRVCATADLLASGPMFFQPHP